MVIYMERKLEDVLKTSMNGRIKMQHYSRFGLVIAAVLLLGLGLAGCSSSGGEQSAPAG